MNMPGFTAEASLYKVSERSQVKAERTSTTTGGQGVIPQYLTLGGGASALLGLTCQNMLNSCVAECDRFLCYNGGVYCKDGHLACRNNCCFDKYVCCIKQVGLLGPGILGWPFSPKCYVPPYSYPYSCP
jgi:hypothetical protein